MSNSRYLTGKHVIVTGAGRGIGAAIVCELAQLGADITLLARTEKEIEAQAQILNSKTFTAACDISDEKQVKSAFERSQQSLGPAYALVNNAGQADAASFLNTDRQLWDRMLAVNLTGAYLCSQQVLPRMIEAKAGRIINIASTAALRGYSMISAYCAAKHGLVGLTRALAAETAKLGITVNAVCPAYTETALVEKAIRNLASAGKSEAEARAMLTRTIPRGALIRPEEVANVVAWLCSPNAGAISGQAIAVAGGEVM